MAAKLQPIEIAPQHLASVIMNTKNSFLSLRGNNGDVRNKRNLKSGKSKPLIIQHFSSVDRRDWEEQYQAGCHIYVNKNTGEVSVDCPFKSSVQTAYQSKKLQQSVSCKGEAPQDSPTSPINKSMIRLEPIISPSPHGSPVDLMATQLSPPNTKLAPLLAQSATSPSNVFISSGSSVVSLGSLGISSGRYQVYDDEEELGTGSLVYDRNELEDMINLLDSTKMKG